MQIHAVQRRYKPKAVARAGRIPEVVHAVNARSRHLVDEARRPPIVVERIAELLPWCDGEGDVMAKYLQPAVCGMQDLFLDCSYHFRLSHL